MKQGITVNAGVGARVQTFTIKDGNRETKVNLYYDGNGYLSKIETQGRRIDIASVLPLLSGVNLANVQTAEKDNFFIDLLKQGAYTERRSILENNGNIVDWGVLGWLTTYRTKFFPRGARGIINSIDVYCRNTGAGDHVITLQLSPQPGMGAITTLTLTVVAGSAEAWRRATLGLGRFWNYDSLCIVASADSDIEIGIGLDRDKPLDSTSSPDLSVFTENDVRLWIKVNYCGQTVCDVPISGIVNNIALPNSASVRETATLTIPNSGSLYDTEVIGAGYVTYVCWYMNAAAKTGLTPSLIVDGYENVPIPDAAAVLNNQFISTTTPEFTIGKWDAANHYYTVILTKKIPFKRNFKVGMIDNAGLGGQEIIVYYAAERLN